MTDEQLDDLLKTWKKKGADRVLTWQFVGAIPFAVIATMLDATPTQILLATITYLLGIGMLALLTQ